MTGGADNQFLRIRLKTGCEQPDFFMGKLKIAIVGSGISGLTAAYRLHREFDIDVFEAAHYAGGHTNTAAVSHGGESFAIDTGFIVFNDRTYPNFMALLRELDVAFEKSDMGFSVRADGPGLEYCGSSWSALFAQRRNLLSPRFHRMLRDILRFNRLAVRALRDNCLHGTLGAFLDAHRFSRMFVDYYIIPMGAAIWSAQPALMFEFPARSFIRFFHNHGLLSINDRPTWYFIKGGSRRYVEKLTAGFRERIHLNSAVTRIERAGGGVKIVLRDGTPRRYDHAVIATHSDQALAMLADASEAEKSVLGAIPYQENTAVLHTDERLNYHVPAQGGGLATLTYDMNILQRIDSATRFCVTLNETSAIARDKILYSTTYHHPVYTAQTVEAQRRWSEISGQRNTNYCGAYWFYGFHEDGVNSALRACEAIRRAAATGKKT
jgi:uncharacterized protein